MWFQRTIVSTKLSLVLSNSLMFLWLTGCVGIGTTTIPLTHETLPTPEQRFSEHITMQKSADDLRARPGRIGHATVTLFAIESGTVKTTGSVPVEVVMQVKQALESLGYQVALVDSARPVAPTSPILKVTLKKFYFKNYNWLWPIVPTWGDIELGLTLEDSDGKTLFDKSFKGSGNSFCLTGGCAFESAAKEALTEVLSEIVKVCSTEEFRQALNS